jgi:hypothetical protein
MQPKNASLSQLMGIRLLSPSPTILKGPDTEPGVPISIQLTLNASLEKKPMNVRDIWISLTRTTKVHTINAKLQQIVPTSIKVNPISNDAYTLVERSGGTVTDEILRLDASTFLLSGPDGLPSYAEYPEVFNIILRIPGNLAGTVETACGSVSYALCINVITTSGDYHVVGTPLEIRRLEMTSSSDGPLVYLRRYPRTTMTSETTIPQIVSAEGIFQVQLDLRSTGSLNDRTTTRLEVREVKWAVDELVRVLSILTPNIENQPSQSREIKRHTRRLTNGKISSSCFKGSASNANIQINFDVVLTKKSQTLSDVQQTYPQRHCNEQGEEIHLDNLQAAKRLDIVVSHILVVEIVVDEVVLDNKTGQQQNLPAMRKLVHCSNYILQVGDVNLGNDPDGEIEYLPQYSKLPSETSLIFCG